MTARLAEFNFSVAGILGQPGEQQDVVIRSELAGIATALARLDERPLTARLRAESVVEGVLVTGRVEAPAVFECARCLAEFASEVEVDVCELFLAPGQEAAASNDDVYRVSGVEIDVEPMLRDAVTLGLPLNPLCRAACRGLCAQCGRDLNQSRCSCRDDDLDPRWAPLAALRARLEG